MANPIFYEKKILCLSSAEFVHSIISVKMSKIMIYVYASLTTAALNHCSFLAFWCRSQKPVIAAGFVIKHYLLTLRGIDPLPGEATKKLFCFPLKRVYSIRKEFAPRGANSFLIDLTTFQEVIAV